MTLIEVLMIVTKLISVLPQIKITNETETPFSDDLKKAKTFVEVNEIMDRMIARSHEGKVQS